MGEAPPNPDLEIRLPSQEIRVFPIDRINLYHYPARTGSP